MSWGLRGISHTESSWLGDGMVGPAVSPHCHLASGLRGCCRSPFLPQHWQKQEIRKYREMSFYRCFRSLEAILFVVYGVATVKQECTVVRRASSETITKVFKSSFPTREF
jgi:hypothetical protein